MCAATVALPRVPAAVAAAAPRALQTLTISLILAMKMTEKQSSRSSMRSTITVERFLLSSRRRLLQSCFSCLAADRETNESDNFVADLIVSISDEASDLKQVDSLALFA